MIIEIALGIVLAVIILALLPVIIGVTLWLLVVGIVLLVAVAVLAFLWNISPVLGSGVLLVSLAGYLIWDARRNRAEKTNQAEEKVSEGSQK